MSELSRDIQALAGEVAAARAEIDRFRTELRAIAERILNDNQQDMRTTRRAVGTGAAAGLFTRP